MKGGISTKLLIAMLVAVILPLGVSAVLLTLAVDSSFQVGINRRVQEALERTPVAYRALFDALKSDFEHSTDGIVVSAEFSTLLANADFGGMNDHLDRLVTGREDLIELRVVDGDDRVLAESRHEPPAYEESYREWREERDLTWEGGQGQLVARWIAPRHHFESFQSAGEMLEAYQTLQQGRLHVRDRYVAVYLCMVGVVLFVALGFGFFMSRRVTTRVTRLAEATRQVAGGDLTTRVPVGPRDEVGELAATFNAMVARLLESRERIEYLQRVAAWQQLARRLAHEIKNPLTPIQLAVQEVRDRYRGDDEDFERVLNQASDIVVEEVEALRRLTTEFSSFAKLPEVDPQPIELRDFLDDVSQSLALLQSDLGTVEVVLPKSGIMIDIDQMLMKRVLDNLVRNAVEAIDGAGEDGHVVVRGAVDADGRPTITVEDDGPGIDETERRRIFEPYYTTKETGTGLGLAIVKKIVLEHGGLVTLTARKTRGTKLTIRLPA